MEQRCIGAVQEDQGSPWGVSHGDPGRGGSTHVHDTMLPVEDTSTTSLSGSLVTGSYSTGGTITVPSARRMPTRTASRRPVRKAPTTGPVVRMNGYSMTRSARRGGSPGTS